MADILCPTCGKPNTDDHSFCDFCGGPIKEPEGNPSYNSYLEDDSFTPESSSNEEQADEVSRLDSLFSEQDPDQPSEPRTRTS